MVRTAFGGVVSKSYLSAEDERAGRLYEQIGFRTVARCWRIIVQKRREHASGHHRLGEALAVAVVHYDCAVHPRLPVQ